MTGLIIRSPWIEQILDGSKTWEIRGRATARRGPIALIRSGSGCVVGLVDLKDCLALSPDDYRRAERFHRIPLSVHDALPYPRCYAWVLAHPRRLLTPQPYVHPRGAVIWVTLPDAILADHPAFAGLRP